MVTGSGSVIGDCLYTDERIKAVTFTGSPEVGIAIRNKAGLKKVILELGSNSALNRGSRGRCGCDDRKGGYRRVFLCGSGLHLACSEFMCMSSFIDEFVGKFVAQTGNAAIR